MIKSVSIKLLLCVAASLPAINASAAQKIGLVAPMTGDYANLGRQAAEGAELVAPGSDLDLTVVDESCSEGGGETAAQALIDAGAVMAVGFFCTETLRGALPLLKEAGIPALTISVRSDLLMVDALQQDWPLYRLAPNGQDQIDGLVELITGEWSDAPVALLDDGTIYFREIINAVSTAVEANGLKPVFVDTFRPAQEQQIALVRRLGQTGATHVVAGGSRSDIAIIARDAAAEGIDLTIAGTDALQAADEPVPLQDGVLAIGLPEPADLPPAADIVDQAAAAGIVAEGYVVPAAAAVSIAAAAIGRSAGDMQSLEQALTADTFDTAMGPVSFNKDHELSQNPFMLLRWQNGQFVPVFDSSK